MNRIPPRRRRALIVEDEILIALDLEDAMSDLGCAAMIASLETLTRESAGGQH